MDSEIEELAQLLVHRLDNTQPHQRILVGIAGVPASGKSTFAELLTERVNTLLQGQRRIDDGIAAAQGVGSADASRDQAILVGLDGWHLSRAQLDALPDPQTAHDRRGIHWTFDGAGYVAFLRSLRAPLSSSSSVITAPSFNHALKDPTADAVAIWPHHRIVVIEGLYVFLGVPPWRDGGLLLDERWFIGVDPGEARRRLVRRHVLTGVARDMKEAEWRADENDGPNGQFIIDNMLEPTRIIQSKDIPSLSMSSPEHAEGMIILD